MKTFCKNQENLCTFETNRQKKKEKVKRQEKRAAGKP
jgi:hypothetical protein